MFKLFKEIRVKILIGYLLLIVVAFFSVFFYLINFPVFHFPMRKKVLCEASAL